MAPPPGASSARNVSPLSTAVQSLLKPCQNPFNTDSRLNAAGASQALEKSEEKGASKSRMSSRAPLADTDGNKRKRKNTADEEEADGKPTKKKSRDSAKQDTAFDVSGIKLDGEEDDAVQIYDTCGEIRMKIDLHLDNTGVTKASFLRDLERQFIKTPRKLQSAQLASFCSKYGPSSGNTSAVFYAAYVFFEKLRIKDEKPKSDHRLNMEKIYRSEGGFQTKRVAGSINYWCQGDTRPYEDQYGQIRIH
jgi:hypothetical protein